MALYDFLDGPPAPLNSQLMEKVNHYNCTIKIDFSMGPSVKFFLAIIDSISTQYVASHVTQYMLIHTWTLSNITQRQSKKCLTIWYPRKMRSVNKNSNSIHIHKLFEVNFTRILFHQRDLTARFVLRFYYKTI